MILNIAKCVKQTFLGTFSTTAYSYNLPEILEIAFKMLLQFDSAISPLDISPEETIGHVSNISKDIP